MRRRHHRRRHHSGGHGDDGQAGDPRRRGVRARRLSARRRGAADRRARRAGGRGRLPDRRGSRRSRARNGATALPRRPERAERLAFWAGRKAAFPAVGRISPDYYCMDGTIPRKAAAARAGRAWARCRSELRAARRQRLPRRRRQSASADPLRRQHARRARARRGVRRRHPAALRRGRRRADRRARRRRREARPDAGTMFNEIDLDAAACASNAPSIPSVLLNPGKVFPTLRRCAELGRVHVHRGKLPFPDMPRF